MSRRDVLRFAFWVGAGTLLAGIGSTLLNSLYPRGIRGFGTKIAVGTVDQIQPGKPFHHMEARAWIVKLDANQARLEQEAGVPAEEGAILALYQKCPHLGCTVPYRPDFSRDDPRNGRPHTGWFLCPCHGSTYTPAGVRVFGPAPRSMDVFAIEIKEGRIIVDTGTITMGSMSNAVRAVMPA